MKIQVSRKSVIVSALAATAALFGVQAIAQMTPGPRTPAQTQSPAADPSASFEKLDANKDGAIDKKEAARMAGLSAVFDKADGNHDGKLDRKEFDAARSKLG